MYQKIVNSLQDSVLVASGLLSEIDSTLELTSASAISDGNYRFFITSEDPAGNISQSGNLDRVTIDTENPTAYISLSD